MQGGRFNIRVYFQPAFLICVAVLAIAGGGMSVAVKRLGLYLQKEPWPLKKPLDLLDERDLSPYKVESKPKIENPQIIKELGTEDYIQWLLEDTGVPVDSPVRKCLLFITYYDLPDRVPHIPEQCYAGTGHQLLTSISMTIRISRNGKRQDIPARHLVFASSASDYWYSGAKFSAFYLFSVNGDYAGNRQDARMALNKNIFSKHSYFSKVEWNFLTGSGVKTYLNEQQATAAGQKLLSVILPVLETEHWPSEQKEAGSE